MALWLINYKIEKKLVAFKNKKKKSHVNNMMDLNMFFQNKSRKQKIAKQFLMAQRFCLVDGSQFPPPDIAT